MNNHCKNQEFQSVKYCQPQYKKSTYNSDYPVDVKSDISPVLRANTPFEALPPSPVNGGLFSGPQAIGPYASIPVPPSGTYYIHENLKSANPPPGATTHYIGYNRSTNNYLPMPGIFWLNDSHAKYPADNRYHIKFSKDQPDQR